MPRRPSMTSRVPRRCARRSQNRLGRLRGIELALTSPRRSRPISIASGRKGRVAIPGRRGVAARLLRPQDRLVAIEKLPEDAAALRSALSEFRNVRVVEGDGYERLPGLLPPAERRGVILIDPPYEADDEFERAVELLAGAHRPLRHGNLSSMVSHQIQGYRRRVLRRKCGRGCLHQCRGSTSISGGPAESEKERLSAAGLLVVNPPFGFEDEMNAATAILSALLGRSAEQPATIKFAAA